MLVSYISFGRKTKQRNNEQLFLQEELFLLWFIRFLCYMYSKDNDALPSLFNWMKLMENFAIESAEA